jgi:pyrroline-5-carboxylate reductase
MGTTVAILGAGVMGETLLSGLIRSGRSADDLIVTARRPDRADELARRYGVRAMSNTDAAEAADTLVLVVKPQDMGGLVEEIRGHVSPGNLVVSLAAGIPTQLLESRLPDGVAVVRVMPNTPALVDQGMAAVSPGRSAAAVVPPGEVTCSRRTVGCCPVSRIIVAAPKSVWTTSSVAVGRGRPSTTPASIIASTT